MLSHDASLRKSEADSSKMAFSTSINWGRGGGGGGGQVSHLHTASGHLDSKPVTHPCGPSACHSNKRLCS